MFEDLTLGSIASNFIATVIVLVLAKLASRYLVPWAVNALLPTLRRNARGIRRAILLVVLAIALFAAGAAFGWIVLTLLARANQSVGAVATAAVAAMSAIVYALAVVQSYAAQKDFIRLWGMSRVASRSETRASHQIPRSRRPLNQRRSSGRTLADSTSAGLDSRRARQLRRRLDQRQRAGVRARATSVGRIIQIVAMMVLAASLLMLGP